MKHYNNAPETVIIFTSFGRDNIALKSLKSLIDATAKVRDKVKIIVSDATPDVGKVLELKKIKEIDLIWTPSFTSAATSRNIAVEYLKDKYSPEFVCFVEDDFEYSDEWYQTLVDTIREYHGRTSPLGLAYGIFSGSPHNLEKKRVKIDKETGLTAYIFGAIADQRFMYFSHYLSVLRMWDPDVLGISYCQTGMQTSRNVMRGFCGGIIQDKKLSWPIEGLESTWSGGKRDVGPPAHDLDVKKFKIIQETALKNSHLKE
jgi:hypothetical protein